MRKVTYSIKIMPSEATVITPSELTSTLLLRSLFQVATLIMCGKKPASCGVLLSPICEVNSSDVTTGKENSAPGALVSYSKNC